MKFVFVITGTKIEIWNKIEEVSSNKPYPIAKYQARLG